MEIKISCECGKEVVASEAQAGLTVDCECGKALPVPSVIVVKQTPAAPRAAKPRLKLTWRKKLAYTAVMLSLLAVPGWLLLEITYRLCCSIPVTGGVAVAGNDGAHLPDTRWNRDVISRFRRSENPILFYEPNPGVTSGPYAINSAGFRDHEYNVTKEPGVFRIVMLGDSIVWGHGLKLPDTFSKQLETLLNQASEQKFEVLNFGVSGYSTQQEVELYRVKASQYDPDLVIVGYCLNDFEESSVEGDAFRHLYYGLFSKSYFYDYLCRVAAGVAYNQFGYLGDSPKAQFDLHEQFRMLEAASGGGRNVVVVFPVLYQFDDYLFAVEHQRIRDALAGLNFEMLDLLDVYGEYDSEQLILHEWDHTHPNVFGTRLAAQATFDLLVEEQLVPIARAAASPQQ